MLYTLWWLSVQSWRQEILNLHPNLPVQLLICQVTFAGMDFVDSRRKPNVVGKFTVAVALTVMCIIVLKQSPGFTSTSVVSAESLHN